MVTRASISVAVDVGLGHAQAVQRIRLVLAGVVDGRIGQLVFEEALEVVPGAARRRLAVGQDAALGVFGEQREIQALDGLAAFVGQLGADAAFVFEAWRSRGSRRSRRTCTSALPLSLSLGSSMKSAAAYCASAMLQGHQVAGDVAGVLDAQAQVGHDGRLLHDEFVAVVGLTRVIQVEHKRQIVLGVIVRAQVALLERAVRTRALARIVNPANEVIVIVLFADAAQIGGEGAADQRSCLRRWSGRPGSRASLRASLPCAASPGACFGSAGPVSPDCQMNAAMAWISSGCRRNCGILVVGRNSCVWPSQYGIHSLWIFMRTSFRSGPTFLISCSRSCELLVELLDLRVDVADGHGQVGGLLVVTVGDVVAGGLVAEFVQARNVELVRVLVVVELQNLLASGDEQLVLIVEALELVAADAALFAVDLLGGVEHRRMLGDGIGGVALLAAGVVVLRIVERPEPVLVAAVRLFHGVERAAVAAVAGRAAEFFVRVELQQVGIGMAGEGSVVALGQAQIGLGERHDDGHDQRIGGHVAGLAAIHQAHAADVVDLRARRVDVDLAQLDVQILDALQQARESAEPSPGRFSLT